MDKEMDEQVILEIRKVIDKMPGGFFIYQADDMEKILYANCAMLRIMGCDTMEEFLELTKGSFRGLVHPDDLEAVESSIAEQITQSQYDLDYVEYRVIRKDGEVRWIDDYGHFTHNEIYGDIFYVFAGDATEKKEHQEAERVLLLNEKAEQERKLQGQIDTYTRELERINEEQRHRLELIEGLSIDYETIFYVDLDADRLWPYQVSERIKEQFAKDGKTWSFREFFAEYIRTWVYPEDHKLLMQATDPEQIRSRLSKSRTYNVHYRIEREERVEHLLLHVVEVGNAGSAPQVVLGCRSMDEEIARELEQKEILKAALKQAEAASNVKNIFWTNMSHDIRTPMNAILGFAALAKKRAGDREKLQGYLDMIEKAGDQMLHLLSDVLEISRLESGEERLEEKECCLSDVLYKVQKTVLPSVLEKEIHLTLDISGLKHDNVYGDMQKLEEIFSHIVGNAVKYTERGGRVLVTASERSKPVDGYVAYRFMIEDNGIGISEEFLKHVFEPFERQKNTTLSGVPGTGLGLAITKNLVEMMGGTIEVESVQGVGSIFFVALSLRMQGAADAGTDGCEADGEQARKRRILLVEDNEINLEIEVELLEEEGFLIDTALNGKIAMEKICASPSGYYDLILMDIQMPVMNGYQTARAVRRLDNQELAGIPIVALSANAFEEDKKMAIESGMNAHIAKPVNMPLLLEVMEKLFVPR